MKNCMMLLLIGIITIGCKEVKLTSCDIDVYHDGELDSRTLNTVRDEAIFEKNWNLNFILKEESEDYTARSSQFALLRVQKQTKEIGSKEEDSYPNRPFCFMCETYTHPVAKYRASCNVSTKISSPELKKAKSVNAKASKDTVYSGNASVYARDSLDGVCNTGAMNLVKKLPTCVLK
jgi:hypothetical protein